MKRSGLVGLKGSKIEQPAFFVPSQVRKHLVLQRLAQQKREIVLFIDVVVEREQRRLDRFDLIEIDDYASGCLPRVVKGPEGAVLNRPVKSWRLVLMMQLCDRLRTVKGRARNEY